MRFWKKKQSKTKDHPDPTVQDSHINKNIKNKVEQAIICSHTESNDYGKGETASGSDSKSSGDDKAGTVLYTTPERPETIRKPKQTCAMKRLEKVIKSHDAALLEELRQREERHQGNVLNSLSTMWSNVHFSRPSTPSSPAEISVDMDVERLDTLITKLKQTFYYLEDTIIPGFYNDPVAKETVAHLLVIDSRDLLNQLYQSLVCARDVHRLGARRMFGSQEKRELYLKTIEGVLTDIRTEVTEDKKDYEDRELNLHRRKIMHCTHGNIDNNFLPNLVIVLRLRLASTLCPKPLPCKDYLGKYKRWETTDERILEKRTRMSQTPDKVDENANPTVENNEEEKPLSTKLLEDKQFKWPLIDTSCTTRLQKERELHTLMSEIDNLMEEVGLRDLNTHNITYELVMMGEKEMAEQQQEKELEHHPFVGKQAIPKTARTQSDSEAFIEDLDSLLNTCDD